MECDLQNFENVKSCAEKLKVPPLEGFPPKSSILIGFSIIFTIHFGIPLFLETPMSKELFVEFGGSYLRSWRFGYSFGVDIQVEIGLDVQNKFQW